MASKELSILLTAKDMASKTIGAVTGKVSKLGSVASTAGRGIATLGRNVALAGAAVAVGIGAMVKAGIANLATLETAVSSVNGAIKQMGLAGQVTGSQVATWANEIEASVGAAFDDKDIVAATATLIRFGKVTPGNLRPAMQVITDLAVKTGSVDSAATLLAKALAAPEKAAGRLARSGIILTKEEQKQITAMVKAGKTAQAQAFILTKLTKVTKGAALASQGPYKRALSILADVTEDAQKALAEGFLPVLEKIAKFMSTKLADPKVIADIRSLGQSLAGALDKAAAFAMNIPWDSVKDAMKMMGTGAKAAFDLFTGLPPWVQTAVLTGWGLNKLTGGAVSSIVGQLASGLIKGVLGMNAGVVNINAGIVNGGGLGGVAGAAGAAGGMGLAAGVAALAAGVAVSVLGIMGLGELSNALSTPEQKAAMQQRIIEENLRKRRAPSMDPQRGLIGNLGRHPNRPIPVINVGRAPGGVKIDPTGKANMFAGIGARALAAGFHPSDAAIAATAERNAAHRAQVESNHLIAIRTAIEKQKDVNVSVSVADVQASEAKRFKIVKPNGSRGSTYMGTGNV